MTHEFCSASVQRNISTNARRGGLDLSDSGQMPLAYSCDHDNYPSYFIKGRGCIHYLSMVSASKAMELVDLLREQQNERLSTIFIVA